MTSAEHAFRRIDEGSLPGGMGSAVIALVTILLMGLFVYLSQMLPLNEPIALALILPAIGALTLYLVWHNERIWVYLALMAHLLMMIDQADSGVGLPEVAFGSLVLMGLAIWFIKEVLVHRRRIVLTGFDLLLLMFIIGSSIVSLIASQLNDGDLVNYLKEWMSMLDLLFYFPLRKHMERREDVVMILVAFALLSLANGTYAFLNYKQRIAEAVYQWQVGHSRSNVNETTSMGLMIMCATVFAASRTLRISVLAMMGVAAGALFVVISLSRGPIVSGICGIFLMMALIPFRQSRRVLVALVFALAVGAVVGYIFFAQYIDMLSSALAERLISVASAGSDFSIKSRVTESKVLLEQYIATSPLLGTGYGVFFRFFDPITATTTETTFVHNGYIWSMFKFGIPMALLLLGVILYPVGRLLLVGPRRNDRFNRALMAGTVAYIIASLVVHMTSNLFGQISTILNFTICWGVLDYVVRSSGRTLPGSVPVPDVTVPRRIGPGAP